MQAGPELGDQPASFQKSILDGRDNPAFAKLMPILFGLIAGMLIMLVVVYFFPHEYKQNQTPTAAAPDQTAAPSEASALPSVPSNVDPNTVGLPVGTTIQTTSTTASGYPIYTSGTPRAVELDGPQVNETVIEQPGDDSSGSWANPCVDPPSVKRPNVRVVER